MAEQLNKSIDKESSTAKIQKFGRFLSGMVMPNIGAFIAWGIITALFIPTGWFPNENLATLVGPMIMNMLPLLIGYTGGKLVYGQRGGVLGAIATMGVIVGADIPMFIGAMIMGPLGGYSIKKFDGLFDGKIKPGFEMLVNNFSAGIIGMLLSLLAYLAIGPVVLAINGVLESAVNGVVTAGLLPLASVFIEPGKILFLNNAMNHGVLGPLGIQESKALGQSIFFLLETNPGPGLGILLSYWMFAKGMAKQSSPGAIIIHFFGGIHEIYFPYVLMNPILVLAVIAGGASGVFTFSILGAGLVATPSPGSIFALMAMTPKGGFLPVLAGVAVSTAVSFVVASFFIKRNPGDDNLEEAQTKVKTMKKESKGKREEKESVKSKSEIKKVIFACDAGMGSSAMGASSLKNKFKKAGIDIYVTNKAIDEIPEDADILVTHESLGERARKKAPNAEIVLIRDFINSDKINALVDRLTEGVEVEVEDNSILSEKNILLGLSSDDKNEAIKKAGQLLYDNGYITKKYIDGMLKRDEVATTYIGNGVAIPHGVNEVKNEIKKTGIVFLQYPEGIDYDDENTAYLVIGIAGKGDEHLEIISNLAISLEDEKIVEKLIKTSEKKYIIELLNK